MLKNAQRSASGRRGRPKFWTQERLNKLNDLRLRGYTYPRIRYILKASSVKACKDAMSRHRLSGLERKRNKEESANLQKLISASCGPGISDQYVADKFKVSKWYVLQIRRKHGIPSGCGWGGRRTKQGTNPTSR